MDKIVDLKSFKEFKRDEMWLFEKLLPDGYIPVEILIDTEHAYKKFDHPLWLYFQDKYGGESDFRNWVPITIEDVPTIPFDISKTRKFKIPLPLMNKLARWIIDNQKVLKDIADGEIENIREELRVNSVANALVESYEESNMLLTEMSTIKKKDTGLPCDIYIDNTGASKNTGHQERIKFDNGENGSNPRNWSVITVYGDKRLKGPKGKLSDSDIKKLISFVDYNKDNIIKISDQKIDIEDFKKQMIRIDKSGNFLIPSQKEYSIYSDAGYSDYKIIYNNDNGLFSYINNDGKLIIDKWFDYAGPFKLMKNKMLAYCSSDEQGYYLSPTGELKIINY